MSRSDFRLAALLALASLTPVAVAAQQRSCFPHKCLPEDIEVLFLAYLQQIPDITLPSLQVRCGRTDCVAVFVPSDSTSALGAQHLLPLYEKGWNIVSWGTGGSVDPRTGEREAFVRISSRSGADYRPL